MLENSCQCSVAGGQRKDIEAGGQKQEAGGQRSEAGNEEGGFLDMVRWTLDLGL
jgi:hypothetical protein